ATRKKRWSRRQAVTRPANARSEAATTAVPGARRPEATGLSRFSGCWRSSSASSTSFRRYAALATAQKTSAASAVVTAARRSVRLREKIRAAKTKPFFTHCLERRLSIKARTLAARLLKPSAMVVGLEGEAITVPQED